MELGEGRVAVVTGAGSGIGLALADALAAAGCSVVLADVQDDSLAVAEEQVGRHGGSTLTVRTDVREVAEVEALASATVERFGGVHVVCNNAGVAALGEPWAGSIEAWHWVIDVNFWGVVHGVRAFLPHLIASGGGHIVNTASIAGLLPGFSPAYSASKHAVVAVTEELYHALTAAGIPIGVSCLCPGWVRTGILDADRNWPTQLGDRPAADPAASIMQGHVRRAIDEGTPPAKVADLVVDAICADRFWVFPNPDFLELAVERFHRIAEGLDPEPPENTPGLPPRSQMLAEVAAAIGITPPG